MTVFTSPLLHHIHTCSKYLTYVYLHWPGSSIFPSSTCRQGSRKFPMGIRPTHNRYSGRLSTLPKSNDNRALSVDPWTSNSCYLPTYLLSDYLSIFLFCTVFVESSLVQAPIIVDLPICHPERYVFALREPTLGTPPRYACFAWQVPNPSAWSFTDRN